MARVAAVVAALVLAVGVRGAAAEADGAILYRDHCARCHGPQGRGDGPEAATLVHPPRNLRDGFLTRHSVDDLVARIRTGRQLPLTLDPVALRRAIGDIDAVTAHIRRIPSVDWAQARRGRELFEQRCAGCHGPTGEGAPPNVALDKVPPDLGADDVRTRLVGDRRSAAVRHQLPGMPGLRQVPDEIDTKALAAWVSVLSPGFRVYDRYCAGCHGDDGRPPAGVAAADRPKVIFDAGYLADLEPGELEDAASHMVLSKKPRMPHMAAELSESQTRAIVDYLRTLP